MQLPLHAEEGSDVAELLACMLTFRASPDNSAIKQCIVMHTSACNLCMIKVVCCTCGLWRIGHALLFAAPWVCWTPDCDFTCAVGESAPKLCRGDMDSASDSAYSASTESVRRPLSLPSSVEPPSITRSLG